MTNFDLSGQTLTELRGEYAAGLHFTGGYWVRIETQFALEVGGQSTYLSPDIDPPEAFKPIHGLVGKTIAESPMDGGTLTMTFDDGARIVVPHNGDYEAWTATGPDGLLIVCMPSGDLATWSGTGHDESN